MATPLPQRVPENAPGDFYVKRGVCLHCCIPHSEAPGLLDDPATHSKDCHFRRQPHTEEEVEQAIQAIYVSCVGGPRYGGTDQTIIARLRELGCAHQCDHAPESDGGHDEAPPSLDPLPLARTSWWRWLFRGVR
jgi:hypothetical protein